MSNPLSKRIRRHVTGRIRDFFAVTTLGFEKPCFDELMSLPLSVRSGIIVSGGVEFRGKVHDCYLANLNLRTASRILMRIGCFKATNFTQVEKKLSDFPWELFLCPTVAPRISVAARHSRLYHKGAIAERFQASIIQRFSQMDRQEEISPSESCGQEIFVRVVDDRFTISIDSSGEILHKRGIKKHGGEAPIRETIAAAALKLSGYDGSTPLLDPMCGSGTFSIEAAMMATNTPPGCLREFAFMGWPSFAPQRWAYIKRESEKGLTRIRTPLIFASDQDRAACDTLKKSVRENELDRVIRVASSDFFELPPSSLTDQKGLVVLNPPYGERLGTKREIRKLFNAIFKKLKHDYKDWKIALIAPDRQIAAKVPFELSAYPFNHGGAKRILLVGKIPS